MSHLTALVLALPVSLVAAGASAQVPQQSTVPPATPAASVASEKLTADTPRATPSGATRLDAKPRIVLPGSGRMIDLPGARTTLLLDGRATEGNVAVLEFVVPPRSFGAPPHVHQKEDEYFYVLEGEIRFLNEDRTTAAPAGTFAAMTRGHVHAFWNASDAPARLLLAIAPGEFGTFFDEVVAELRANKALDLATIRATIVRLEKAHGIVSYPDLVPAEARPFLSR